MAAFVLTMTACDLNGIVDEVDIGGLQYLKI